MLTLVFFLVGCMDQAPASRPDPEVGVVDVAVREVPVEQEYRGRVAASRTAQVRARVTGVVMERVFTEGQTVEEGQVLFRIDPAPLRAVLEQARAQEATARAGLDIARRTAERLAPLAGTRAVSQQSLDDAQAAVAQSEAGLQQAQAAVTAARLNLSYTTVTAPISGRIGQAFVTEGALVSAGELTPLATIVQLDPVYVDLTVPATDLLRLRRSQTNGATQATGDAARVQVIPEDGQPYEHEGSVVFTDVTVDPGTGNTLLRASVPNPDGLLLPGLFVRGRLSGDITRTAMAVPQQALQRDANGASLYVVEEGVAQRRPVQVAGSEGDSWLVTEGLADGDTVIVDGVQHLRVGEPVRITPWQASTAAAH